MSFFKIATVFGFLLVSVNVFGATYTKTNARCTSITACGETGNYVVNFYGDSKFYLIRGIDPNATAMATFLANNYWFNKYNTSYVDVDYESVKEGGYYRIYNIKLK
jgi:hypothetical protein